MLVLGDPRVGHGFLAVVHDRAALVVSVIGEAFEIERAVAERLREVARDGALAGTGGSDEGRELPRLHAERQVVERHPLGVGSQQSRQLQELPHLPVGVGEQGQTLFQTDRRRLVGQVAEAWPAEYASSRTLASAASSISVSIPGVPCTGTRPLPIRGAVSLVPTAETYTPSPIPMSGGTAAMAVSTPPCRNALGATLVVEGDMQGMQMRNELSGTVEETTLWDPASRLMHSSESEGSMSGVVSIPSAGMNDIPIDVTNRRHIRLTGGGS